MTIAANDQEMWAPEDGAPQGIEFDITVPSQTRPDLTYRIARGQDGTVYHIHACERWKFGHVYLCSHVKRAVALAEQPEATLLDDLRKLWQSMGGALASGDDLVRFWREAHALFIAAREVRWTQLGMVRAREEWDAMEPAEQQADALATFDRGPVGNAR